MERREKRLQNLSMLRQISAAAAIIAVALTAASIVGIPQGGLVELVIGSMTLLLWLVAIVTFVLQHAQSTTERTIEDEYERWWNSALNIRDAEKPKRKTTVHLTDDGELSDDESNTVAQEPPVIHKVLRS
jgi:hypothetical protein